MKDEFDASPAERAARAEERARSQEREELGAPARVIVPGPWAGEATATSAARVTEGAGAGGTLARTEFKFHEIPEPLMQMVKTRQAMTYHSLAKLGELEERKRLLEEEMVKAAQQLADDRRAAIMAEETLVQTVTGKEECSAKIILSQGFVIEGLSPDAPDDFALNMLRARVAMERVSARSQE